MSLPHFDFPSIFSCAVEYGSAVVKELPYIEAEADGRSHREPKLDEVEETHLRLLRAITSDSEVIGALCASDTFNRVSGDERAHQQLRDRWAAAYSSLLAEVMCADATPEQRKTLEAIASLLMELCHWTDDRRWLRKWLVTLSLQTHRLWDALTEQDRQDVGAVYAIGQRIWGWPALGNADDPAPPKTELSAPYADLRPFAATIRGDGRRILELLCDNRGECPLANLAVVLEWPSPWDNAWESARQRLNMKLRSAKRPYRLIRSDNRAKLQPNHTTPSKRSAPKTSKKTYQRR